MGENDQWGRSLKWLKNNCKYNILNQILCLQRKEASKNEK